MGSKIQRINSYDDKRFDTDILNQHGAFIVEGKYKCAFNIISENSAIVTFDKEIDVAEIIDEFRFYSEHIIKFYNIAGELIKSFPSVDIFEINIRDIQPSQFFVDIDKVKAIEDFIKSEEDIFIPLTKIGDSFISLDGHTRLYYAVSKGYSKVNGYLTESGDYIEGFIEEARRRKIYSPFDLELISHEEYEIKWHKFCEDFFRERE
ncbi:MAG: hypothetical protein RR636_14830 [Clostridium sp.]|uniref:hypothetical protein n=1 Tax=Clostridium sp. TaxID=1506 RepID=UPI003046F238